jgi:hypothetical protein
MEDAQQLAEKLKNANNVLVTVGRSPSVDGLSALLGLGLLINKEGKHSAAVFSGVIPSTIDFLKPEETLEKNTDSLRDFIIALDKSKADKLRYKVEDDVVRIFITPYKTSISQEDLDFSQGDFNVDLVIALGVDKQEDLDEAITAHGRILHDATVASINIRTEGNGDIGNINWTNPKASSLSEMVSELAQLIDPTLLDGQIATALLTGIVSETDRFSNEKTSSKTMAVSASLMGAGANQQLVATKLEEPIVIPPAQDSPNDQDDESKPDEKPPKTEDGTLDIEHDPEEEGEDDQPETPEKEENPEPPAGSELPKVEDSEMPKEDPEPEKDKKEAENNDGPKFGSLSPGSKIMTEPPALGGTLTANTSPENLEPSTDPLSLPDVDPPMLFGDKSKADLPQMDQIDDHAPSLPLTPPPGQTDFTLPPPVINPEPTPIKPDDILPPTPPPSLSVMPPAFSPLPPLPQTYQSPFPTPTPALDLNPAVPGLTPPPPAWVPPTSPLSSNNPLLPSPVQVPESNSDDIKPVETSQLQIDGDGTISQLEEAIDSPHVNDQSGQKQEIESAREEIDKALSSSSSAVPPSPIAALNAQPLGPELHPSEAAELSLPSLPSSPVPLPTPQTYNVVSPSQPSVSDPPPVPPPIPFEFGKSS